MTMKKQNANIKDEIFTEFPNKGERLCDIYNLCTLYYIILKFYNYVENKQQLTIFVIWHLNQL